MEMQNDTAEARRNIRILVERLKEIKESTDGDVLHDRQDAEDALLDYIADPEVKWAFQEVLEQKQ